MRKAFLVVSSLIVGCSIAAQAFALSLDDITNADATGGLRQALTQGASAAVANLGKTDGFLGNAKVKIPLPEGLRQAESVMRTMGMGRQADELVTAMNRAAEAAVAESKPILVDAVKKMSVQDAKEILTGGDDSVTKYFRRATSDQLSQKFKPIVTKATKKVKLAEKYDRYAGRASQLGLVKSEDAKVENYVTRKAMDGLFAMIAEEERAIRKDPVAATGALAKKVFGALGN